MLTFTVLTEQYFVFDLKIPVTSADAFPLRIVAS